MELREILRTRRTQLGMSQAKLAEKIGCTPGYISNIENGVMSFPVSRTNEFSEALDYDFHKLCPSARKVRDWLDLSEKVTEEAFWSFIDRLRQKNGDQTEA